jgi:hypothetical protein
MNVCLLARQKGSFFGTLAAGALIALFSAPVSAIGEWHAVAVSNCGVQATKPTDLTIACGDGNDYLKSLRWTFWSDAVAKGSGVEEVNDCNPYCAAGKFHSYPVTVTLDRVQSNRFTRLRIHYSGARPPNTPQDVSRTL